MTKGGREYQLSAAFSCIRSNYVRIFQAQRKHRSPMGNRRISTQHTIPKQQTIIAHGSLTQSHIIAASSAPVMWYPIHSSMVRIVKQSIIINDPFSVARPSQNLCKPPMWCRIEAPHFMSIMMKLKSVSNPQKSTSSPPIKSEIDPWLTGWI